MRAASRTGSPLHRRSHLRHRLALPAFREFDAGVPELLKPLLVGGRNHDFLRAKFRKYGIPPDKV
jgi:hypothetical protein